MPRNPGKTRCTFPDCRAWSLRTGPLCTAHAKQFATASPVRVAAAALPLITPDELPTLQSQILDLVARRMRLDRWLMETFAEGETPNLLEHSKLTANITARIFRMLTRYAQLVASQRDDESWITEVYDHLP